MAVQWLRFHASTAGGVGSIPGLGTKIPYAAWPTPHPQKNPKTIYQLYKIKSKHNLFFINIMLVKNILGIQIFLA